jgi:hypothetical protein
MTAAATLILGFFQHPVELSGLQRLLLLLPLCLSISVVYKTTRCERLGDVPLAAFALWATLVLGMVGVGVLMWLAYLLLA